MGWRVLTNHARVLVCIAQDPEVRLRDLAQRLGITERAVAGVVSDLTKTGYLRREKAGRRNRYRVQEQLPLPEVVARKQPIGDLLAVLVDDKPAQPAVTDPQDR